MSNLDGVEEEAERMKLVTYNVNGLRQRVSQFDSLLKLLDSFDADIICFQVLTSLSISISEKNSIVYFPFSDDESVIVLFGFEI